jgi:glycosyltransferase involved in cell wall biosynthesis
MSTPKRVAIIGASAESLVGFRAELIRQLVGAGTNVYALAPGITHPISEKLTSLGAHPVSIPLSRGGLSVKEDFKSLITLRRTLREIAPDIVLSYFAKAIVFGTLAAFLAGVPKRFALLEGLGYFFTQRPEPDTVKVKMIRFVMIALYWISLPLLHSLIVLNRDDLKDLVLRYRIPVRNIKTLGAIGLPLEAFPKSPVPHAPVTFLFMGRLLREKGIHEFLEAASHIKEKYRDTEFIVVGGLDQENPGALSESQLSAFIDRGIISYQGHVSDPAQWISRCSVFVLPSYREGFPRSTQEAMAVGRAIITTDVPGCRETVRSGENGFLIPPFDSKALAEKMAYLIENPEQLTKMGQQSQKRAAEEFDEIKNTAKLVNWILSKDEH